MTIEEMKKVEQRINYTFKEISLLQQAFVRKSYADEHGCEGNEVLEFIGDKALDVAVIQLLVREHCSMTLGWKYYKQQMFQPVKKFNEPNVLHSNKTEGELTDIKKALVQRKNLARRMDELGFIKYISMSQSDIDNHVDENASVKEDLFEAIIGAVAIDCEWDMKTLISVVDQMLQPDLNEEDDSYVNELQEWSQKKHGILPMYEIKPYNTAHWYLANYIYDSDRMRHLSADSFIAYLTIKGVPETILGAGYTQSEARQEAARYALKVLDDRDLLLTMKDVIGEPSREFAINQLEILFQKKYIPHPEYAFEQTYDGDGNPIWHCKVYIPETKIEYYADSSAKKDAKKDAAYQLLNDLLTD